MPSAAPDAGTLDAFRRHMDDDLDTPGAIALLFNSVRSANAALDNGQTDAAAPLAAAVKEMAKAIGLELRAEADEVDDATAALVSQRDEARASKDFTAADRIRAELESMGWVVEDTPGGTKVRRA
jgi:cysteinyl-tRNA synthetase